jgi:(1->4)-alpha-D-glucan 1-alpha-D-glucosylmutase
VAAGQVPASTYRLQLTPGFGFAEAAEAGEYLANLGVTHVYLSPILDAVPGSMHGYDVTDHSRIRGELGGEEGFRAMAKRLRGLGLSIVVDIVPNHMAVPADLTLNRQLWPVLRDGCTSPFATWFDIDWEAQDDRMLLPILGDPVESCLGDLRVEPDGGPDDEPALRYFDHVLPLRPGTARLPIRDLLESQYYRLAWWREASAELNWRRFFNITTLIGVRVEDPAVFDATHEVVVRLVAEGLVDGLRIDHPDGLADPRGYLARLASATNGAWVVVEKILEAGETLPADWACAGTTGYDALRLVDGLFLDPSAAEAITADYARFSRRAGDDSVALRFADVATGAKREAADMMLAAEVNRLARLVADVCPDATEDEAGAVLVEVLAAFPVYRAYVHPGEPPSAAAEAAVGGAVAEARGRLPKRLRGLAGDLGAAALGTQRPAGGAAGRAGELVVRFQQTTGPVLAKGVEDTAFYRWSRLLTLNEVGGNPDRFGVLPDAFHAEAERLAANWPATMTTLTTHDTKREEDVRARLAVLAEIPARWAAQAAQWHDRAAGLRILGSAATAVDPDTEYLIWQTLVGTWPISGQRLAGYLTKAIREANRRTSWADQNPEYEAAVHGLAACAIDDPELSESIAGFVAGIAADALANSLGGKLVQLTMPGVPDVYQGCDLSGLSLVDPDNRRDVDFARRRALLADLDADRLSVDDPAEAGGLSLDAAKLLVTARTLRLRQARPEWFTGGYTPMTAAGPAAAHVLAFARGGTADDGPAVTVATRLPVGLRDRGGWSDTVLPLAIGGRGPGGMGGRPGGMGGGSPPCGKSAPAYGGWVDVLTGAVFRGERVLLGDLMRALPVALLVPEGQ